MNDANVDAGWPRHAASPRTRPRRAPVAEASGCMGSLRAFAFRTQAGSLARSEGGKFWRAARIAAAHRSGLGASGHRHWVGRPNPRGAWARCARLAMVQIPAAATTPRCKGCHRSPRICTKPARRSGHPHHRRQPAATATVPRSKGCHRSPRHCTKTPPSAQPLRTTGASPRPPPPCHVARGVAAVSQLHQNAPVGPATSHHRRQPAAAATTPRCKGCHRSPRNCTKTRPSARPLRTTGTAHVRRHRATLQGVSPQSPQLHQTRPSARPLRTTGASPRPPPPCHVARGVAAVPAIAPKRARRSGHPHHRRTRSQRHRATLQGVSPQSPQLHQTHPSVRPSAPPAHPQPTPPSHVARGVTAVLAIAPNPPVGPPTPRPAPARGHTTVPRSMGSLHGSRHFTRPSR